MRKKSISIVAGCLVSLLIMTPSVYAAEQVGYHHDAQTDTADYCLSVYDVSIDLSELRECGGDEQKIQNKIIETANPAVLIRNSSDASGNWIRLSYDELTFDFSQFQPEENADGYTVAVSAPAIKLNNNSEITFQVYVTNNSPEPRALYAFITFADTDLADMEWDVTSNPVMTINDIPTPQKDGYTFCGWYRDADCTDPFLLPDNADYAEQKILSDMTLYPKWEKNTVYAAIHFADSNLSDVELDITYGASLSILNVETPVKDGYTFLGWYLDAECTEPFLLPGNADYAAQDITGDITLYPKWEKNTVLATVHFADGCLPDMELDITYGASLTLLNIKSPVKNGYSFCGWYLDENCTEPFLLPDNEDYAAQEITGDITLYPKWEKNTVYAIVHFAGGEFADITLDITDGVMLTLTTAGTPTKDGYTFSGWYLDSDFTIPFLIPGQTGYTEQTIIGNITLYSKWQPIILPPAEQPEEPEPPTQPVQSEQPLVSKPIEKPTTPIETIQPEPESKPDAPVQTPNVEKPVLPQEQKNDTPVVTIKNAAPEKDLVKEGVPMYEIFVLALFAAITAGFGFSIASDVRVLNWYRKKKQDYLTRLEMTL